MSFDDVKESEQGSTANSVKFNQIDEQLHQIVNESEQHKQTEEITDKIQMIKK